MNPPRRLSSEEFLPRYLVRITRSATDEVECPICKELWEDIGQHFIRRVRACRHVFCLSCLENHIHFSIRNSNSAFPEGYRVTCPLCRTLWFEHGRSGRDHFMTAFNNFIMEAGQHNSSNVWLHLAQAIRQDMPLFDGHSATNMSALIARPDMAVVPYRSPVKIADQAIFQDDETVSDNEVALDDEPHPLHSVLLLQSQRSRQRTNRIMDNREQQLRQGEVILARRQRLLQQQIVTLQRMQQHLQQDQERLQPRIRALQLQEQNSPNQEEGLRQREEELRRREQSQRLEPSLLIHGSEAFWQDWGTWDLRQREQILQHGERQREFHWTEQGRQTAPQGHEISLQDWEASGQDWQWLRQQSGRQYEAWSRRRDERLEREREQTLQRLEHGLRQPPSPLSYADTLYPQRSTPRSDRQDASASSISRPMSSKRHPITRATDSYGEVSPSSHFDGHLIRPVDSSSHVSSHQYTPSRQPASLPPALTAAPNCIGTNMAAAEHSNPHEGVHLHPRVLEAIDRADDRYDDGAAGLRRIFGRIGPAVNTPAATATPPNGRDAQRYGYQVAGTGQGNISNALSSPEASSDASRPASSVYYNSATVETDEEGDSGVSSI